jgi:hypothetical protein
MQRSGNQQQICPICNEVGLRACSGCKSISYCSIECQQTDWPVHKLLCKFQADLQPPTERHRRGILFPADLKGPKFAWVSCDLQQAEEDEPAWELSDVKPFLGSGDPFPRRYLVQRNVLRSRDIGHTIEIAFRDSFLIDGSILNQSVVRTTNGVAPHAWKGPVLALRKKGLGLDPLHYDHITMSDFRDVVDYFLTYGGEAVGGTDQTKRTKVKGVKISCEADQKVFGTKKYVSVQVPREHPVFTQATPPCPISELVELPVLVRKYPADKAWAKDKSISGTGYNNQAATFLHLNTDPNSRLLMGWGWAPMEWQNNVGSVIVVRADGKDLSPHHCEVLCTFCQFEMQPLFEDSMGAGMDPENPTSKDAVLQQMTKENFERYFTQYRASWLAEDPSWSATKSPYLA